MKYAVLLSLLMFKVVAAEKFPILICHSHSEIDGWNAVDTHAKLRFTAYVGKDQVLHKAVVEGAYFSDMYDIKIWKDASKEGYVKYGSLEDAWNWFMPILPENILEQKGSFVGIMEVRGEEGYGDAFVDMTCFIKK